MKKIGKNSPIIAGKNDIFFAIVLNLRIDNTIMMATSFAQAITQFATLRILARIPSRNNYAQIIRDLFPKARTEPRKKKTSRMLFEIAWSFLSLPTVNRKLLRMWTLDNKTHRIGDLPAEISEDFLGWYVHDRRHRRIRDLKTGRLFPAVVGEQTLAWHKHGPLHQIECDARTGLRFPALIGSGIFTWVRNGSFDRVDIDPMSGLTLPAMINGNELYWYQNGKSQRIDKKTGRDLPVGILCNVENWKEGIFFMV